MWLRCHVARRVLARPLLILFVCRTQREFVKMWMVCGGVEPLREKLSFLCLVRVHHCWLLLFYMAFFYYSQRQYSRGRHSFITSHADYKHTKQIESQ